MTPDENADMTIDHSPLFQVGKGPNKDIGIVLCHGFTGSPHSMKPWAEHLIAQGYTVSVPLLPGHGTHWKDLSKASWHTWYRTARDEVYNINNRCETSYIVGLSMGGAIALKIAAEELVNGAIVVNPALTIDDPRAKFTAVAQYFKKYTPAIGDDIKKPGVKEGAYPKVSVKAAHQAKLLFKTVVKMVSKIDVPVLVFKSRKDHIVSGKSLDILKKKMKPQFIKIIPLYNSYHVATLDNDAGDIFQKSDEFFQENAQR